MRERQSGHTSEQERRNANVCAAYVRACACVRACVCLYACVRLCVHVRVGARVCECMVICAHVRALVHECMKWFVGLFQSAVFKLERHKKGMNLEIKPPKYVFNVREIFNVTV